MRVTKKSAQRGATTFAAAALILGLTACATGSGPAASDEVELSDEDVTLNISWWGGDARVERTQKILDAFEEENPNITVEAEFSDWTGYWDRLATSTAGKNSPDVIQMDELYLAFDSTSAGHLCPRREHPRPWSAQRRAVRVPHFDHTIRRTCEREGAC
jgi:ABC-type glycerol-3-phosphate transport system substrate-binding protein